MTEPSQPDYDKPVAYDAEGRPLYAHPSTTQSQVETSSQTVHISRSTDPEKPVISDATRLRHNQSVKIFPGLNLSEGEYIISAVRRHPIGLFFPLVIGVFFITISLVLLFNYDLVVQSLQLTGEAANVSVIVLPVVLFISFSVLGTYVNYYIYTSNKFFLTNESVIQEIQTGLFSKREQTVSLSNIEDASYTQDGIIQQIFNYGSIRLSTEGEETTYRFSYVANPKKHIAVLNNAVEAFKNGRPVGD